MDIKLQAPVNVQLVIYIVNDDTKQDGVATFELAKCRFHDEESIRAGFAGFQAKHMPTGFRLMTKREWLNSHFGQHKEDDGDGNIKCVDISMPGGEDWEP